MLFNFMSLHPQRIVLPVGEHVKHESYTDGTQPPGPVQALVGEQAENGIDGDGIVGMKGMEADTHAVRVEERVSQQVVSINNHRAEHDEIGLPPTVLSETHGQQQGSYEM